MALRSSGTATQWELLTTGTLDLAYLDVRDANITSGTTLDIAQPAGNSIDSGNNTDWRIGPFSGGDGSSGNPWQIASLEDLRLLTENNEYWGDHFLQTANIDASSTQYWDSTDDNGDGIVFNDVNDSSADGNNDGFLPISTGPTDLFFGVYDGSNKVLSNLFINTTSNYAGLFAGLANNGTTSAELKNLILTDASVISSGTAVGAWWEKLTMPF